MKTPITKCIRHVAVFTFLIAVAAAGVAVYAESANGVTGSSKTASAESDGTIEYVVAKGDTLYGISRKFNVSVDVICKANNLTKNSVLRAGKKLTIPMLKSATDSGTSKADSTSTAGDTSKGGGSVSAAGDGKGLPAEKNPTDSKAQDASERKYDTYTVQKGDTFWHIAQINDMTVDELKRLNNLTEESTLKAGQKLKVPATIVDTSKAQLPDLPSADPRTYTEKKVDPSLVWPVKKPKVVYVSGKVSGVQLTAGKNEAVTAIRAGTVTSCGNYRGFGNVVFVLSKTGLVYAYGGLGSVKVTRGQYVVFGDVVGTAGTDSIKGTSQIMFMVYQKGLPMDPAAAPRG